MALIYKIAPTALWEEALAKGQFDGAPVDLADGFIHFSTADQVRETAAKHFRNQGDLLLIALEAELLGPQLKWEPSRGGALFPHLYSPLATRLAAWAKPIPMRGDGTHDFDGLLP